MTITITRHIIEGAALVQAIPDQAWPSCNHKNLLNRPQAGWW